MIWNIMAECNLRKRKPPESLWEPLNKSPAAEKLIFCSTGASLTIIFQFVHIGLTQQTGKLVFENNAVIARPVRTLVVAIPWIF